MKIQKLAYVEGRIRGVFWRNKGVGFGTCTKDTRHLYKSSVHTSERELYLNDT